MRPHQPHPEAGIPAPYDLRRGQPRISARQQIERLRGTAAAARWGRRSAAGSSMHRAMRVCRKGAAQPVPPAIRGTPHRERVASHARGRRFETRRAHRTEGPLRRAFLVLGGARAQQRGRGARLPSGMQRTSATGVRDARRRQRTSLGIASSWSSRTGRRRCGRATASR
jgi:hypothetical protein